MEKFFLIEISAGDEKIKGKAIYGYNTLNEAVAMFHKKLGTAMSSNLYEEDLVMVIGDNGVIYESEKYIAEVQAEVQAE